MYALTNFNLSSSSLSNLSLKGEESAEFLSMVAPLVEESLGGCQPSYNHLIRNAIDEFQRAATAANDRFATQTRELIVALSNGENITVDRVKNLRFLLGLTEQVGQRYAETVEQLMNLQDLREKGRLGEYSTQIEAMYLIRIKRLELVNQKLEVARLQENHEINFLIALHNQELKIQTQKMNQAFECALFSKQEEKREQRRQLDLRAQKLREEEDLLAIAQEEKEIREKIKELKKEHRKEMKKLRKKIQ